MHKYNDGYFDNQLADFEQDENEVFLDFKENYGKLLSPLAELFPVYFR